MNISQQVIATWGDGKQYRATVSPEYGVAVIAAGTMPLPAGACQRA